MSETITGRSFWGSERGTATGEPFFATDPASGERLEPAFHSTNPEEVDRAARRAAEAASEFGRWTGRDKARLLRAIAARLEATGEEVVERASRETALSPARLRNELARTTNQLRLFADLVEEGSWVEARWDRPRPAPTIQSDLRSMLRPLGPVAVFGASNFPLAFSVAGGDTAAALAAGNPVLAKAHPAHPGTSELAGLAIAAAARECGAPEGTFSLLFDSATAAGAALVRHPAVRAVAFTGSLAGGRALMGLAAARPEPIPVFAEMGSVNPVFLLPGALREKGSEIIAGLYASVTLGGGQFCTKPGLVIAPAEQAAEVERQLGARLAQDPAFTLLTRGIARAYAAGVDARASWQAARSPTKAGTDFQANATLFKTSAAELLRQPRLSEELFGPAAMLVAAAPGEMLAVARGLAGHLTATIHGNDADLRQAGELVAVLERKVGRLVINGFPTGVAVSHAMVHGGPYPATSDSRSTSVGTRAITRFARPVCYQDAPESLLPAELQADNPLGIWRLVDGQWTR
ncbi:MAG: aldehyde dehydrogenase (NADP(+)) [Terriglobales bacterium]